MNLPPVCHRVFASLVTHPLFTLVQQRLTCVNRVFQRVDGVTEFQDGSANHMEETAIHLQIKRYGIFFGLDLVREIRRVERWCVLEARQTG